MARQKPSEDDEVEIEAGPRRFTHTDLKDWVNLAGLSDPAARLYWFLRMHVNRKRGDQKVTATTLSLAKLMGRSRGDKTAPWLAELVAIRAVEVYRRGVTGRYVYRVFEDPPDDYTGLADLPDWYAEHREELAAIRAAEKTKRDQQRQARRAKTQVTACTPDIGGTGETDVSPPDIGGSVPPISGVEPDVLQPDGKPPPVPPSKTATPEPADAVTGGGGDPPVQSTNPHLKVAHQVLAQVQAAGGVPPARLVRGAQATQLATQLAARLDAGWTVPDATQALTGPLGQATSIYGALRYRITNDLVGPPVKVDEPPRRPEWCGECDDKTRILERPGDRPTRCPACHPLLAQPALT